MIIQEFPFIVFSTKMRYNDIILLNQCIHTTLARCWDNGFSIPFLDYIEEEFDTIFHEILNIMSRASDSIQYSEFEDSYRYVYKNGILYHNDLYNLLYQNILTYINVQAIPSGDIRWTGDMKGVVYGRSNRNSGSTYL